MCVCKPFNYSNKTAFWAATSARSVFMATCSRSQVSESLLSHCIPNCSDLTPDQPPPFPITQRDRQRSFRSSDNSHTHSRSGQSWDLHDWPISIRFGAYHAPTLIYCLENAYVCRQTHPHTCSGVGCVQHENIKQHSSGFNYYLKSR